MSERDEFEAYVAFLKRRAGEGQREAWLAALDFKASALTDGQIVDMWNRSMGDVSGLSSRAIAFARALLRATPPQAVPALTDEQIAAQDARYAIDGAIAYGRMGTNQPPAGHWLTEYWAIGQQLARLGETSIWDNQTPVDKTVKFARYDAMDEAGRQASEAMRRLEKYLEEISAAPQPSQEPEKALHTHGDRSFTMKDRNFSYCGNGWIQDNNFDFDAGWKITGDFVDDDKDNYSKMIVDVLNAAGKSAKRYQD